MKLVKRLRVPRELHLSWPSIVEQGNPSLRAVVRKTSETMAWGDIVSGRVAILVMPNKLAKDYRTGNVKLPAGDYLEMIYRNRVAELELVLRVERILISRGATPQEFELDDSRRESL